MTAISGLDSHRHPLSEDFLRPTLKVSLVLATVGRSDELDRCLAALCAQTSRQFEVILVDQNEDDRLDLHVKAARIAGLQLLHLHLSPPSLSNARNLGLSYATGSIVGFPDDDCWYEADTIEQVVNAFTSKPQLSGIVGCWVEQSAACSWPEAATRLNSADWRRFRGGSASSISLFLRSEVFAVLGGFDTRLGVGRLYGAAEETDLLFRALCAELQIERWPLARVHHAFGLPPSGSFLQQWKSTYRRARGTGALYTKHRLPSWVRLRGLVAPCLKAIWHRQGLDGLAKGVAVALGRLDGMLRWWLNDGGR